jgi:N utilization substance protein A
LEVPEVEEGIVKVKSISREPGERTKIAVFSSDDKIDPVGACVGMKGNRVKNIVRELNGEKIDIIHWTEKLDDFVKSALSPAEIKELKINKENNNILAIVNPDQLSLAIGRHGQNVRLASRLIGMEIDIRTPGEVKAAKLPSKEIASLPGVGKKTGQLLQERGLDTIAKIAKLKVEDLIAIPGIGKKKAVQLIENAKQLVTRQKKH